MGGEVPAGEVCRPPAPPRTAARCPGEIDAGMCCKTPAWSAAGTDGCQAESYQSGWAPWTIVCRLQLTSRVCDERGEALAGRKRGVTQAHVPEGHATAEQKGRSSGEERVPLVKADMLHLREQLSKCRMQVTSHR